MGLFDRLKKKDERQEMIKQNTELEAQGDGSLVSMANAMLMETRLELTEENSISVPIGELAALGGTAASLIPALRTVTQTTTIGTSGLYQLANAAIGDTLKVAKNGNFWGAFKTAEGSSKFAQLVEAGPLSATTQTVMPIEPATMMMAVALYSIEQQLGEIIEMEKQILSFLEQDKEAEIEADLKTLTAIIQDYKFNWDKEQYISSHHKLALDIKRTAEKNMTFYQKQIAEVKKSRQLVVASKDVNSVEKSLEKKFKYYRLSLYIYSLASFLEVMLLGNFQEAYISQVKGIIEKYSAEYIQAYEASSGYIDKMAGASLEANVVKGIGTAEKAIGNFLGSIPLVKDGTVDEWLVESGSRLQETGQDMKKKATQQFEVISDAGTDTFVKRFEEMNRIYNHTSTICFDNERIYLVEG